MITIGQTFADVAPEVRTFKKELDGTEVWECIGVEQGTTGGEGKNPFTPKLAFYFDVAFGKNAGVCKELTEKWGKPEYPWMRYYQRTFILTAEELPFLRGFIATIANEPENAAFKAAIDAVTATGNIDEQLIIGRKIGAKTKWQQNKNGYWNKNFKEFVPVAVAKAAPAGTEKPEGAPAPKATGGFGGQAPAADSGSGWS